MASKQGGNPRSYNAKNSGNKRSVHHFSAPASNKLPTNKFTSPAVHGSVAQQSNNSEFVNFLNGISNFQEMSRDTLVEHMYTTEPEIATAVDSFALMVRNSYQFFDLINYNEIDNIPDTLDIDGTTLDFTKGKSLAKEMVDVSNAIGKEQDIKSLYEQYAAVLKLHGTTFILINDNGSLTQLPNDHVTIIDKLERIQGMGSFGDVRYSDLITEANYLVLDENLETQKVYPKGKFMIIRFHDTPVYIEDCKGRVTFGIYGVSPLRRAIIPVWYRRIVMANDALWRYKAMPRSLHQLNADSFNTSNYTGTPKSRMEQAQRDASAAIESHKVAMENMPPDASIVTLDTTNVKMIESTSANHMDTNGIITQMTDSIFTSIGLPRSIIQGMSSSNYAGELVIYAHANMKIIQVAEKISKVVLLAMKRKLVAMNPEYPIDLLDIHITCDLAANDLESSKIAQLMDSMGKFTNDEVRARMNYAPLTAEQKSEIEKREQKAIDVVNASKLKTLDNGGANGATSDGKVTYPTTVHSQDKQGTNSAESKLNDALEPKKKK